MPWSETGLLAACAGGALGLSAAGAAWAIAYARRRGMVDEPGERRSHATATPRGGGIGIAIAALLALGLSGWWRDAPSWGSIAAGLLLVAGVGWWDDHRPLPIMLRLGAHVGAGLALAWGLHLQGAGLPAVGAALILVPVLVNAWNFMDGIDGLAASQALLCASGLACLLAGPWQMLGVALASARRVTAPLASLTRAAVAENEMRGSSLALLEDRIRLREGGKQIYASQVRRNDAGEWEAISLEDPAGVDARRASVGLGPLADYLAGFAQRSRSEERRVGKGCRSRGSPDH